MNFEQQPNLNISGGDNKKINTKNLEGEEYNIFHAFSILENKIGCMEPADREWFQGVKRSVSLGTDLKMNEIKQQMLSLYEKYRDATTATYKKISPLTIDTLSSEFGGNKSYAEGILGIKGLEEVSIYLNRVGNAKPVTLLQIQEKKYVIKHAGSEYLSEYRKIQESEHRPPVVEEISIDGEQYGLFEFKGEQVMDFTNKDQLKQLCEIGVASSLRKTIFDNNPGNLLVEDGRVFYIDQGLTYVEYDTTVKAMLKNIREIVNTLPNAPEMSDKLIETIEFIAEQFKKAHLNTTLSPDENLDTLVREDSLGPLLNRWSNEDKKRYKRFPQEVEERIVLAVKSIFI